MAILGYISRVTGIIFTATNDGNAADFHFAAANIAGPSTSGFCSWHNNYSSSGGTIVSYSADAYIYLDNAEWASISNAPTVAGGGYELLLHEIGHALGLKHSFEGAVTLGSAQDSTAYSLMSYTHVGGPYGVYSPYDIAALMWLYGGDGLGGKLGQGTAGRYLVGSESADTLIGGNGNDSFEGGAGSDVISGGAGIDTARYSGTRAAYTLTASASGLAVSGPEGSDSLQQVERLAFSGLSLAFDLNGAAGTTARFLGAVFGREAVTNTRYAGIGLALLDGGSSTSDLMQLALEAQLGRGFSNEAEVRLLYRNLVGTEPAAADLNYWVGTLTAHQYTPLSLALMAAELPLNALNIDLVGLAQTGLGFT